MASNAHANCSQSISVMVLLLPPFYLNVLLHFYLPVCRLLSVIFQLEMGDIIIFSIKLNNLLYSCYLLVLTWCPKNEQNLATVRHCSYIEAGLHLGKGVSVKGNNGFLIPCTGNYVASLLPMDCSVSYVFHFFLIQTE